MAECLDEYQRILRSSHLCARLHTVRMDRHLLDQSREVGPPFHLSKANINHFRRGLFLCVFFGGFASGIQGCWTSQVRSPNCRTLAKQAPYGEGPAHSSGEIIVN